MFVTGLELRLITPLVPRSHEEQIRSVDLRRSERQVFSHGFEGVSESLFEFLRRYESGPCAAVATQRGTLAEATEASPVLLLLLLLLLILLLLLLLILLLLVPPPASLASRLDIEMRGDVLDGKISSYNWK